MSFSISSGTDIYSTYGPTLDLEPYAMTHAMTRGPIPPASPAIPTQHIYTHSTQVVARSRPPVDAARHVDLITYSYASRMVFVALPETYDARLLIPSCRVH
jgi:hypothetical protein